MVEISHAPFQDQQTEAGQEGLAAPKAEGEDLVAETGTQGGRLAHSCLGDALQSRQCFVRQSLDQSAQISWDHS